MKRVLLAALLAIGVSVPAYALPGEAAAVTRHCGVPHAEDTGTSPVTGRPQRSFIYNDLILHFEPQQGGWSFTTGWRGHFPVTRGQLEESLPCFRAAMREVAAQPRPAIDPTIAQQMASRPTGSSAWGVPFLWLLGVLILTLILFLVLPSRNQAQRAARPPAERRFRTPQVSSGVWKRRRPIQPLQ